MAHINLLPWREEAQRQKQQEFFTVLALTVIGALLIVFAANQFVQAKIDGQMARNQFLKNEIQILDIKIAEINTLKEKKEALEKRMAVVTQLQRSRNVGTKVMDELAKIVPVGVHLTKLEKQNDSILIEGKSESNNHLSNLIRAIEASELLIEPIIESITSAESQPKLLSDFNMRLRIQGFQKPVEVAAAQAGAK